MPGFSESSVALRLSLPFSAVAFLMTVIGMSTPYWVKVSLAKSNFGLWTACGEILTIRTCVSIVDNFKTGDGIPDWYRAVQAVEVIGTLVSFAAVMLIVMCLFVDYVGKNKISHLVAMVTCFITTFFVILGTIIWAAKWSDTLTQGGVSNPAQYLSWSFALCVVGAGLSCFTGILMIFNLRRTWYL